MREDQHHRALVGQFGDGGHRRFKPGGVGHAAFRHGDIQVDADQRLLALHIAQIIERPEPCHLKVSLFAIPARAGIHEHSLCSSTPAFAGVTLFHSDQSSLAIAPAVSTMRFEKPHSLSYQATTRTSLPSSRSEEHTSALQSLMRISYA